MIFRRRNSSINVAAIATASIFPSATGSSHVRSSRRSKRAEAELRAQSAKLLATRLHTQGVGGECIVSNTELAGNKTKRQLRDRLARAQEPTRVTESAELQRETELVGVAAAALYGGEIGGTQGPVPDQFRVGGR